MLTADIDRPGADGRTLRDLCLADKNQLSVAAWQAFYDAIGETQARDRGLLPFRVWQIFDAIVAFFASGDVAKAVCAIGVISHYVGDACQPLHGSMLSDGYRDRADPGGSTWPGKGVHATYEDKMVDRFSQDLLARIGPAAEAGAGGSIPRIGNGQDAAYALITLMDFSARTIPPSELRDRYIELGGGTSRPVVEGLWETFGARTATVMAAGARPNDRIIGREQHGANVASTSTAAEMSNVPSLSPQLRQMPIGQACWREPDGTL